MVLANVAVSLNDELGEGDLCVTLLLITVVQDYHFFELICLSSRIAAVPVVVNDKFIKFLLHAHRHELGASVLVSEVVEAKGPRWVTVKDRHEILLELLQSCQGTFSFPLFVIASLLDMLVELRQAMIKLEVADELKTRVLVLVVFLSRFQLLF